MVRRRTAKRIGFGENSLRKRVRPRVENDLRAHDDDPGAPVLANRDQLFSEGVRCLLFAMPGASLLAMGSRDFGTRRILA